MATVSGTFNAPHTTSALLFLQPGETASFQVITALLTGSVLVERSDMKRAKWATIATLLDTDSGEWATYKNLTDKPEYLRLRVLGLDNNPGSETVDYILAPEGAAPVVAGEVAGSGVTVREVTSKVVHQTIIKLTDLAVPIVSVGNGRGVGGTKVYDFPAGRILFLGCMADLSARIATAKEGDFTDGTPEGDIGIGSVGMANADAFGTDATDDDYATGSPLAFTDYVDASVTCASEPTAHFDGTGTAKDVYVNALIDAADVDDDATTEILVSGEITLTWINLGDI
jgi:hypothetical protein